MQITNYKDFYEESLAIQDKIRLACFDSLLLNS